MIALLDVSVLVPLFDDGHVHHEVAHDWFADNGVHGWASCPLSENGVLRVLTNPSQPSWYVPLPEMAERLRALCAATKHHFWADDFSLIDSDVVDLRRVRGYKQLTDVYLLGLASTKGGKFVTFDGGIPLAAVKGARKEHLEILAPSE